MVQPTDDKMAPHLAHNFLLIAAIFVGMIIAGFDAS